MSGERHSTAVIHPASRIHDSAVIGPYAVIEDGVELGPSVVVGAHAVIQAGTEVGPGGQIGAHAIVGGLPQDLAFDPRTPSGVRVGEGAVLREGVTVHRATREGSFTEVATGSFLMAYVHVGHDCVVGERAILANNIMLAGFVTIGAHAFLGGGAAFHQHARVGESAMISGLSRVSRDCPPFCMMAERDELIGLNLVGLRRRGFDRDVVRELKEAFRQVCGRPGNFRERAAELQASRGDWAPPVARFLNFFASGRRGFVQPTPDARPKSEKESEG